MKQHNYVFNIDSDNKCLLSAYYNDFWRSCDTGDWSNDAENTDLITVIDYILQYIHIENSSISQHYCILNSVQCSTVQYNTVLNMFFFLHSFNHNIFMWK